MVSACTLVDAVQLGAGARKAADGADEIGALELLLGDTQILACQLAGVHQNHHHHPGWNKKRKSHETFLTCLLGEPRGRQLRQLAVLRHDSRGGPIELGLVGGDGRERETKGREERSRSRTIARQVLKEQLTLGLTDVRGSTMCGLPKATQNI